MNTYYAMVISMVLISGCASTDSKKDSAVNDEIKSIGGTRDENGCLPAAGQTWSLLKQDCIQIFSEGRRLNPINVAANEAIISAFIVSDSSDTKVELFLPDNGQYILSPTVTDVYEGNNYRYEKATGKLFKEDVLIYQVE